MATFDNPSYFSFPNATSESSSCKTSSKRFKGWVKLKRHFRPKLPAGEKANKSHVQSEGSCASSSAPPPPAAAAEAAAASAATSMAEGTNDHFAKCDTVYYNFTAVAAVKEEADDDVFVDATLPRTHKAATRRRHSLGSWIRTSFSAIKRPTASTGSAAADKSLLPGVSSTASTMTFRSVKDLRRSESGRVVNAEVGKMEPRGQMPLPDVDNPPTEVNLPSGSGARHRFTPRRNRRTSSLDRRYTNSAELLEPARSDSGPGRSKSYAELGGLPETQDVRPVANRSLKVNRSRTVQDGASRRQRCSHSGLPRQERRRASVDACMKRRCEKCRAKEAVSVEKSDVVIIFSKNCLVSAEWMSYFQRELRQIFPAEQRPAVRVCSRDVENLVNCGKPTHDYMNQCVAEKGDFDRAKSQQIAKSTVTTASLQMVLVSRALLDHVVKHANDPLGQLLDPKRVVALLLDVDEALDVNEYHRAALFSYHDWIRVKMMDLDMDCVFKVFGHSSMILNRTKSVLVPKPVSQPARFKLYPRRLGPREKKVTLMLLESGGMNKNVEIVLSCKDRPAVPALNVAWINPFALSFKVPDELLLRDVIQVSLKIDASSWGSRELLCSDLSTELELLVKSFQNPLTAICQVLKMNPEDASSVDQLLENNLRRNLPLDPFPSIQREEVSTEKCATEVPTLLHFASRYGLSKFAAVLLECPGSLEVITTRNCIGLDCIDIADQYGHGYLASQLRQFVKSKLRSDPSHALVSGSMIQDYDVPGVPRVFSPEKSQSRATKTATYLQIIPNSLDIASGEALPETAKVVWQPEKSAEPEKLAMDHVRKQLEQRFREKSIGKPELTKLQQPAPKEVSAPSTTSSSSGMSRREVDAESRPLTPSQSMPVYQNQSTHTSWSSDRSSVVSCDSGAISDSQDDKKIATIPEYEDPARPDERLKLPSYAIPPPPRPVEITLESSRNPADPADPTILMNPPRVPPRPPVGSSDLPEEFKLFLRRRSVSRFSSGTYISLNEEPTVMEERSLPPLASDQHRKMMGSFERLLQEVRAAADVLAPESTNESGEDEKPMSRAYMHMEMTRNLSDSSLSRSKWSPRGGLKNEADSFSDVYVTQEGGCKTSSDTVSTISDDQHSSTPCPRVAKPSVAPRHKFLLENTEERNEDPGVCPRLLSVSEPNLVTPPSPKPRTRLPNTPSTSPPRRKLPPLPNRPLPQIPAEGNSPLPSLTEKENTE